MCCAICFTQLSTFASFWPPVAPKSVHLSTNWNLCGPQYWDRTQYSMQPASVPQLQLKLLWVPNMHWISYDDDHHHDVQSLATDDCAAAADSHDRYAHYSTFNEWQHVSCTALLHTERELVKGLNSWNQQRTRLPCCHQQPTQHCRDAGRSLRCCTGALSSELPQPMATMLCRLHHSMFIVTHLSFAIGCQFKLMLQ